MYRNLRQCVADLEATRQLVRIDAPVDANLEIAEIQRRLFRAGGSAVLFTNVIGCRFPMLGNLFGTIERTQYLFRGSIDRLQRLVALQVDPADVMRRPRLYLRTPWAARLARPKRVRSGPVLRCETTLAELPQLKCWPGDGGAYVTLPQVYTEDPDAPGLAGAIWACIACSFAAGNMWRAARSGCTIRSTAASPPITPPPCAATSRCRSTSSSAAPRHDAGRRDAAARGRERARLGRRARRPARADDLPRPAMPIAAEADFCITGRRCPIGSSPRDPSAITWATTAWRTISR